MMGKESYVAEISDYIKKNLKKGYTLDSLKWALINKGHSKIEVEKALKKVQDEMAREAPVLKRPEPSMEVINQTDETKEEPEQKPFWKRMLGL